jgi:N-acetylmuramoyl-L-alanine amidase
VVTISQSRSYSVELLDVAGVGAVARFSWASLRWLNDFWYSRGVNRRLPSGIILLILATLSVAALFVVSVNSAQQVKPPTPPGQRLDQITPPALPQSAKTPLTVVVIDPAHGGSDSGARGASGINESEIVMDFTRAIRAALESQGLRVVQTRTGNEGPSFDDRSAVANAQRGAVFVSIHVASTGVFGQVRAYSQSLPDASGDLMNGQSLGALSFPARNGLLPWDRAQEPYRAASRKFAELVQSALAQKFKGSPDTPILGAIRQLRTVGAPAIAIEASSVSITDREQLLRLAPGIADSIAQAVVSFKPIFEAAGH